MHPRRTPNIDFGLVPLCCLSLIEERINSGESPVLPWVERARWVARLIRDNGGEPSGRREAVRRVGIDAKQFLRETHPWVKWPGQPAAEEYLQVLRVWNDGWEREIEEIRAQVLWLALRVREVEFCIDVLKERSAADTLDAWKWKIKLRTAEYLLNQLKEDIGVSQRESPIHYSFGPIDEARLLREDSLLRPVERAQAHQHTVESDEWFSDLRKRIENYARRRAAIPESAWNAEGR